VTIGSEVISLQSNGVVISPVSQGIGNYIISGLGSSVAGNLGSATTISFRTSDAVVRTGGLSITEVSTGVVVVGTVTLSAGGPAKTISGEVVSVGSGGVVVSKASSSALILGSSSSVGVAVETGAAEASRHLDGLIFGLMLALVCIWNW
jgi:hypothetical protein